MEEWKKYTALEFCSNITDGTHDSPKQKSVGHYLITSKHLQNNSIDFSSAYKISEEDYKKIIKRSAVAQYDILFSMIGTIGNIVRIKESNIDYAVKNIAIFKMGGNKLRSKWLYYWLKSNIAKEYISSRLAGSTQSYLTLDSLRNFPILAPSEKEMHKIVSILSSLDSKIELNRRINDNLEQQAQALFKAWFVDFEPFKDGKFVESELGMIPEGWKVIKLKDLCESVSITHPRKNGKLIFLNTGDIECGMVNNNSYMNINKMPGQAKKSIQENDILYSEIRPINKHFAFVNFPADEYIVSTKLMVIRTYGNNSLRIYQFLTRNETIVELQHEAESRSGTFPQIRFDNVSKLSIILATETIEEQYYYLINGIYSKIFKNALETSKLQKLRDLILSKLMSGELKINDLNC